MSLVNNLERECGELEQKKCQYEEDIKSKKQQLTDLKLEAEKQRLIIERECLLLEEYRHTFPCATIKESIEKMEC